ncbi:2-oxoglutarate dehydrogenase complex E2 component [Metarhizium acridum]|nr:2-oxoglutarate dehydrogenase complex E2 component [Metarhizium acridum]
MLSRRIATAARMAPLRSMHPLRSNYLAMLPSLMQTVRTYSDKGGKVPQMAESISEGTLKQFSKSIGDFVEQDEEIATIETDKIDVAVNAPEAGTIKEFLASEEDTVTVGQDLVRIELGGAPSGIKTETKPQQSQTSPNPEPKQTEKPATTKATPKEAQSAQSAQSEPSHLSTASASTGNREERRVKMNRMRLRIAERLKQSQNTAASLTTFNEVDMSNHHGVPQVIQGRRA